MQGTLLNFEAFQRGETQSEWWEIPGAPRPLNISLSDNIHYLLRVGKSSHACSMPCYWCGHVWDSSIHYMSHAQ